MLARLVLDRVLEVERTDDFVSGPEALLAHGVDARRASDAGEPVRRGGSLWRGASCGRCTTLSHKLYGYNTRARRRPALRRKLPDRDSCFDFLGLDRRRRGTRAPSPVLAVRTDATGGGYSRGNGRRGSWRATAMQALRRPALEELPACLPALAAALGCSDGDRNSRSAPISTDCCAPTRLVAYFPSQRGAAGSRPALAADRRRPRRARGALPGRDRRRRRAVLGRRPAKRPGSASRVSWRQWICERLAAALVMARAAATADCREPWRFALDRLGLEGVDTDTFMPTGNWSEAA